MYYQDVVDQIPLPDIKSSDKENAKQFVRYMRKLVLSSRPILKHLWFAGPTPLRSPRRYSQGANITRNAPIEDQCILSGRWLYENIRSRRLVEDSLRSREPTRVVTKIFYPKIMEGVGWLRGNTESPISFTPNGPSNVATKPLQQLQRFLSRNRSNYLLFFQHPWLLGRSLKVTQSSQQIFIHGVPTRPLGINHYTPRARNPILPGILL